MKLSPDGRPLITERQVQQACVDLLRAHGWLVFETHTDARKSMGEAGQPDLVAVREMRFTGSAMRSDITETLLIEVKRRDGRVSKKQAAWHRHAIRRGLRVIVVYDVDDLCKELSL